MLLAGVTTPRREAGRVHRGFTGAQEDDQELKKGGPAGAMGIRRSEMGAGQC